MLRCPERETLRHLRSSANSVPSVVQHPSYGVWFIEPYAATRQATGSPNRCRCATRQASRQAAFGHRELGPHGQVVGDLFHLVEIQAVERLDVVDAAGGR